MKLSFMIDRNLIALLPTFVTVADLANFSAAAARLGVSPSAASQSIRQLEERIGHPLFLRTTRSVSLTEEGKVLLKRTRPALLELGLAVEIASAVKGKPSGLLRLNVPRIAMPLVLEPILPVMRERYPDITIEIFVEDAAVDIVEQGFDAGIRLGIMTNPDMISVDVTDQLRSILVASPSYIARRGNPATIETLQQHDCIGFRLGRAGRVYDWELTVGDQVVETSVPRSLIVNDTIFNLSLVLAGYGIGYLFDALAQPYLFDGTLVEVIPEAAMPETPLCLYFPRYANDQPKLRAFIDVSREVRGKRRPVGKNLAFKS
jgi:DNA-binding transcriptional LysR family regulator